MYKILFSSQAAKTLFNIPRDTAHLIKDKLSQIAEDPFASHKNTTKLQGRPGFRLRIGDWRVIYEIQKDVLVIIVIKIARRGEVYR